MMQELEIVELPIGQQSCRLCGARRGRTEPDNAWVIDIERNWQRHEVRRVRVGHDEEHFEADERPYTRRHLACEPTATAVVEAVTGISMSEDDARATLREHGVGLLAGDRLTAQRAPWGHLGAREREAVTRIAKKLLTEEPTPAPSPLGRCGICGVGSSITWTTEDGVIWQDGTRAPVCVDCQDLVGVIRSDDLFETRALAAMAGMTPTPSLRAHNRFGFRRAAVALKEEERHDPDAKRWDYNPEALAEVRTAAREALPEYILDAAERAAGVERLLHRRAQAATVEAARKNRETPGGGARW